MRCDVMPHSLSATQSLNCYTPLIHQRVNPKHFPPICALHWAKERWMLSVFWILISRTTATITTTAAAALITDTATKKRTRDRIRKKKKIKNKPIRAASTAQQKKKQKRRNNAKKHEINRKKKKKTARTHTVITSLWGIIQKGKRNGKKNYELNKNHPFNNSIGRLVGRSFVRTLVWSFDIYIRFRTYKLVARVSVGSTFRTYMLSVCVFMHICEFVVRFAFTLFLSLCISLSHFSSFLHLTSPSTPCSAHSTSLSLSFGAAFWYFVSLFGLLNEAI